MQTLPENCPGESPQPFSPRSGEKGAQATRASPLIAVLPSRRLAVSIIVILGELKRRAAAVDQEHAAGHGVGGVGAEDGRGAGDLRGGLVLPAWDDVADTAAILRLGLQEECRPHAISSRRAPLVAAPVLRIWTTTGLGALAVGAVPAAQFLG
jgi:hypothetical protein